MVFCTVGLGWLVPIKRLDVFSFFWFSLLLLNHRIVFKGISHLKLVECVMCHTMVVHTLSHSFLSSTFLHLWLRPLRIVIIVILFYSWNKKKGENSLATKILFSFLFLNSVFNFQHFNWIYFFLFKTHTTTKSKNTLSLLLLSLLLILLLLLLY